MIGPQQQIIVYHFALSASVDDGLIHLEQSDAVHDQSLVVFTRHTLVVSQVPVIRQNADPGVQPPGPLGFHQSGVKCVGILIAKARNVNILKFHANCETMQRNAPE